MAAGLDRATATADALGTSSKAPTTALTRRASTARPKLPIAPLPRPQVTRKRKDRPDERETRLCVLQGKVALPGHRANHRRRPALLLSLLPRAVGVLVALRDNQALCDEALGIILDDVSETDEECVRRILDAVDRALTATGPESGALTPVFAIGGYPPDEPVALFRYADAADRWARENYPGRHRLAAPQTDHREAPAACAKCGNTTLERCAHGLCSSCTAVDPCYFRGRHGPWNASATPPSGSPPAEACTTCKGAREVLYVYPRCPGDLPGNAMIPCPMCRPVSPPESPDGSRGTR